MKTEWDNRESMFETVVFYYRDMVTIFANTCFKPWLWKNECTSSDLGQQKTYNTETLYM